MILQKVEACTLPVIWTVKFKRYWTNKQCTIIRYIIVGSKLQYKVQVSLTAYGSIKRVTSKIIFFCWSILFACSDYLSPSFIIHKTRSPWPNNRWSLQHHSPVALRNWSRLYHWCAVKTTHASLLAFLQG